METASTIIDELSPYSIIEILNSIFKKSGASPQVGHESGPNSRFIALMVARTFIGHSLQTLKNAVGRVENGVFEPQNFPFKQVDH